MTFLLEREAELRVLRGRLADGGCALIRGPAGIGKTALLDAAVAVADVPVLSARGSELEQALAFGGVQQLLGTAEGSVHELYWALADRGPCVLAVDDAHWLDAPSLRWLAFLVNRVADLPLAILIAARDEPSELLTRIALHDATVVLEPAPLSRAAVERLGGDYDATGGNPFYVHALLAGSERAVVDSIALRLQALGPRRVALARALAVLDGASGTVAARLAGLDVRTAIDAFEALRGADLVRGDGLAHPLVREAVYAAIPATDRAELHLLAARLLRATPERAATHLLAAGPGGGAWTVGLLREAARAAWARGAPHEAAAFLRQAADESQPHAERVGAPDEVADDEPTPHAERVGAPDEAADDESLPREERVGVLRELARALVAAEGPDGLPVLREALALAEPAERGRLSRELGHALFIQGFFSQACAAFEAGGQDAELAAVAVLDLATVRRYGGLDAIAERLPAAAVGAWIGVARHPPAARGADQAEAALAADPAPTAVAAALVALMAANRYALAEATWTGVAESARASGELERLRLAVALRALVRLRMGRVAEVEADLRELIGWVADLQLPLTAYRNALPFVVAPLIDALVERDQLDEAAGWPALTGLEEAWPEELGFTFLLDSLARLRLAQDRAPEALRLARESDRRRHAWGIRNPGFVPTGATLAAALAANGHTAAALEAAEREVEAARSFGVARETGIALRTLGEIARDGDALAEAERVLAASSAPLEHARALVALGGREAARTALDLTERLGATALAARARAVLVAAGGKPRRRAATGPAALTPAQLRVARLAADGLGNRVIAERLFLTEKTVEGHLGAAYRKLGISSRAQLNDTINH